MERKSIYLTSEEMGSPVGTGVIALLFFYFLFLLFAISSMYMLSLCLLISTCNNFFILCSNRAWEM